MPSAGCKRSSGLPLLRGFVETLRAALLSVSVLGLHGEDMGSEVLDMFTDDRWIAAHMHSRVSDVSDMCKY